MLNEKQFFTKKILQIIENVLLMFTLTVKDIQEMLNYLFTEVASAKRLFALCCRMKVDDLYAFYGSKTSLTREIFPSKTFHTLSSFMVGA